MGWRAVLNHEPEEPTDLRTVSPSCLPEGKRWYAEYMHSAMKHFLASSWIDGLGGRCAVRRWGPRDSYYHHRPLIGSCVEVHMYVCQTGRFSIPRATMQCPMSPKLYPSSLYTSFTAKRDYGGYCDGGIVGDCRRILYIDVRIANLRLASMIDMGP